MSRVSAAVAIVCLLIGAGPLVSKASITPAPRALAGLAKNYRGLNQFKLIMTTQLADGRQGSEEVYIVAPGRFRAVLRLLGGAQVVVRNKDRAAVAWRGKLAAKKLSPLTAYLAPFMCRTAKQAQAMLKGFGIRPQSLGLELVRPRIAVIIGATAHNPSAPQLWLDKDNFFPLRLVVPTQNPELVLTVRYEGYSRAWGWWLPRRITVRLGNRIVRRMEITSVAQMTRTPPGLFNAAKMIDDLPRLRNRDRPPRLPDDFRRLLREQQIRLETIVPR
ncbi:MAG: hypothetical protein KJ621_01755 [Proteobacteria bacterium]|nr:hypothetical protein [Pseudomonadota bacterium]MBU1740201.1 hypothetical protein [Pseudomonadota bacterium]